MVDHETRSATAEKLDPERAARVIRNIGQIETDFFHAAGHLSERMMAEACLSIEKVVKAPWLLIENEWATTVLAPEWKMSRSVGTGDMWLEVSEKSADEEGIEHTWLAAATQTVPSLLCVALVFRRGLQPISQALIRDDKVVAPLWEKGFARDEDEASLFLPIHVPAEKLAQGFEKNDLAPAVAPFGKAMAQAIAARPALDALLDQVRTAAKTK